MEKEIGKLKFYRYKGNNKFQSHAEIESTNAFEFYKWSSNEEKNKKI